MISVGVLVFVASAFVIARSAHRVRLAGEVQSCQEILLGLEGTKESWALNYNADPGDSPPLGILILHHFPDKMGLDFDELYENTTTADVLRWGRRCPSGAWYELRPIGEGPICTSALPGHSLSEISQKE